MYKADGEKIYCVKTGKFVAEFTGRGECNGNLMFMPGMVMQHKKKLKAWFKGRGIDILQVTSQNIPEKEEIISPHGSETDGKRKMEEENNKSVLAHPPFDKALGVKTPGFAEWAEGRSQEEIVAMVRKLEVSR